MERDPRTDEQDATETDESPRPSGDPEIGKHQIIADMLRVVGGPSGESETPAVADEVIDGIAEAQTPDDRQPSGFEDFASIIAQAEFEDSRANTADGVGSGPADVALPEFAEQAFGSVIGNEPFAADPELSPSIAPIEPPIVDAPAWSGDGVVVEHGPYVPDQDSESSPIRLRSESNDSASAAGRAASAFELSPRTRALLSSTSDGGPPLTRPIVMVSLADVQQRRIREEALAAAADRDNKATGEIAEEKVNYAFWLRNCEERALWGDY